VGRQDPVDRPNTPLTAIPMFQRAKLPNALASPGRAKPLTDSTNQTWTRSRLDKERNDWWDTQVTGSQEVWGAIRLAAQSLQAGKLRDAQGWLETLECTCPTGCLWKGVYDSTGVLYKVPEWLIVEPEGLVPEDTEEDDDGGPAGGVDETQDDDDDEEDEPVLVRVRISRDGRDVTLKLRRKEPVASIVEKIKAQAEVCSPHLSGHTGEALIVYSSSLRPVSALFTVDVSTKTVKFSSHIHSGISPTTTSSTRWYEKHKRPHALAVPFPVYSHLNVASI
jgi:hypothetical protein